MLVNRRPSQASRLISQALAVCWLLKLTRVLEKKAHPKNQAAHAGENDGKKRMSLYNRDENLRDTISVLTRGEGEIPNPK